MDQPSISEINPIREEVKPSPKDNRQKKGTGKVGMKKQKQTQHQIEKSTQNKTQYTYTDMSQSNTKPQNHP